MSTVEWEPPEVTSSDLRYLVTSRFLEEFVQSHTIEAVLRELVQNEYDAGGTSLTVAFRDDGLHVDGNGQTIDRAGWSRLAVMAGVGQVPGDGLDVPKKESAIGSKNQGLRALFLIGDRVYVRSGGRQTVLDLHDGALPEPLADASTAGLPGAHFFIPYRSSSNGLLQEYGLPRQERDLGRLADDLAPTLIKLAHPDVSRTLKTVTVRSDALDRTLVWQQKAKRLRRHRQGGDVVERKVDLRDHNGAASTLEKITELEYQRVVEVPPLHSGTSFPS